MASLRIGSAFGIPVELRPSFLIVLPLIAYVIGAQVHDIVDALNQLLGAGIESAALTTGGLPWILGIVAAVGLFAGVLLHEFGHSLVAMRYGLEIESISLWFLGGIAQFSAFPDDWKQEFNVAIAGPIVSVLIGALCYAGFVSLPRFDGAIDAALGPDGYAAVAFVLGYLAVLNIALAAFNMLPGFPMDGGRVLRALLSRNRPRLQATRTAARVGKTFAVLLGIAGILLFQIFWLAIAFFIYIGASAESRHAMLEAAFEGVLVSDVMTPAEALHTVTPETPVEELLERMVSERHTGYPVVRGRDLVGIVTLEDTQDVPLDRRAEVTVGDVMSTELRTVDPDTEAIQAITTIQQEDVGRLLVTRGDDLVGLISRTDLMTVFEVVQSSESAVAERAVTDDAPLRQMD